MTAFTARQPVDLVALVPAVLGFHPEDSAVFLTFGTPGAQRESCHARIDLPLDLRSQRAAAEHMVGVLRRQRVRQVALVLYSDDVEVSRTFAAVVQDLCDDAVIEVVDRLRVDADRLFDALNPDDPGESFDLSAHPLMAHRVLSGRVIQESRTAVAESLHGHDAEEQAIVAERAAVHLAALVGRSEAGESLPLTLLRRLQEEARWLLDVLARATEVADPPSDLADRGRPGDPLNADEVARIAVLCGVSAVRDAVAGTMTRAGAWAQVEFWREVVRRTPGPWNAGPAGLCALAAWLDGDGALAWCAIDRCVAESPDDSLAQYVAAMLDSATSPSVWCARNPEDGPLFAPVTSVTSVTSVASVVGDGEE